MDNEKYLKRRWDMAETELAECKRAIKNYKVVIANYQRIGYDRRMEYLATLQLDSEREANQILTDENLKLRARIEELEKKLS